MAVPIAIPAGDKPSGSPTTLLRRLKQGIAAGYVSVPCGSCNACCRTPRAPAGVLPHEVDKLPPGSVVKGGPDGHQLARRDDGACVLLSEDGKCTIYDRRPFVCRTYDCRVPTLLFGWIDAHDPIMEEAISQWAPLRIATVDDADMVTAMRLALADGGLPGTYTETLNKIIGRQPRQPRWERYLDRARQLRDAGRMLGRTITVNDKEGLVIAITMAGNLVVDLRRSGGSIMEIRLLMETNKAEAAA
jgi:hypothetical protein